MNERQLVKEQPIDDADMPAEIDFSKGTSGLHHIPLGAKVLISIERSDGSTSPERPGEGLKPCAD